MSVYLIGSISSEKKEERGTEMIEVVSYPPDLGVWDPRGNPYLELYGETKPLLCMDRLETGAADSDQVQRVSPFMAVYEYFWTLGVSEDKQARPDSHFFQGNDPGAELWLLFPRTGGWRICEVAAAIRYLRPLPHKHNLMEKVNEFWKNTTPILTDVAQIAKALPIPGTEPTATLLNMLAQLRITSLPPVEGFLWSVDKVTKCVGSEVMEGVHWMLPKTMFTELGGTRLTGSITVYFHPAHLQEDGVVLEHQSKFEQRPILARAVVHAEKGDQYVPAVEKDGNSEVHYLKLGIRPCQSS
jgi:hypothetical protein